MANQLKVILYLSENYYGDIFDFVEYYLAGCNQVILSHLEVFKEELKKYLPDKLYDYDIESLAEEIKKEMATIWEKIDIRIKTSNINEEEKKTR